MVQELSSLSSVYVKSDTKAVRKVIILYKDNMEHKKDYFHRSNT